MPIDYTKLVNLEDAKVGMNTEHAMIASNYSSASTYAVGAYAYYAGTLYKCTTAITTAEAWNSVHWTEAKLGNDLISQSEKIDELKTASTERLNNLGTFLASYVVVGRTKIRGNTVLKSAVAESGTYTWYKYTRNLFYIKDQTVNGVTITHDANGRLVLNGTSTAATSIEVSFPATLSGQWYGYLSASTSKFVGIHLRNSSNQLAASIYLNNSTTQTFDTNKSNITKYQFYIAANETFSDYVVEASVSFLYNETGAANPYAWEKATMFELAKFPIESDVDYYLTALTTTQILLDVVYLSGQKTVRVSKVANAEYTSILQALKSTPDYVTIHVDNGTYNIVDEYKAFYGNDFFTNYDGYAGHTNDPFYRGLWLTDGRTIECDPWAKIVWDYDGDNDAVAGYFSVFATGQNATLIDAHIVFNNKCRYAIHDDYAAFCGTNKYERCIFDGTSSNGTTIGGGCGHRNTYIVKDCLFLNDGAIDISYHNTSGFGINHIIVTGNKGTGAVKFQWMGTSTEITECIASNNKFTSIVCEAINASATNENMHLTAFNNDVT